MPYTLNNVKILLVDDMRSMLTLTKSVLSIFGFKDVLMASNGEEAFEMVVQHDPDLIITDWMMEPMNGLEFTQRLRRDPMTPNPYVPVIMMTGFSSKLRVEQARDAGITEFLMKPFSSRDLYNRVHTIIEKPRQFVDSGEFFGPDRRRKRSADFVGERKRGDDPKPPETTFLEMPSDNDMRRADEILKKLQREARSNMADED
ncbi:MAG TPA: response regulator [Alphaproteobacteria bacterium]|nr:response regulator [Alphaproteobacteria bacterium]